MMLTVTKYCLLVQFLFGALLGNAQSPKKLLNDMANKIATHQTEEFILTQEERINGELHKSKGSVKVNVSPLKLYYKEIEPKQGLELLFRDGDDKALVNPSRFPWVTLKLNPQGKLLRKKQHHTIRQLGFSYFSEMIYHHLKKYAPNSYTLALMDKSEIVSGFDCFVIKFDKLNFKYKQYEVKNAQNTYELAMKLGISEYLIIQKNKQIKSCHTPLEKGQIILVPECYAKSVTIYLDKIRMLPLRIEAYDEKGLFEMYEYSNIMINRSISDKEFEKKYPAYNF